MKKENENEPSEYSDFLSHGFKVNILVSCYCDDGIWYHGVIGAIGDGQYQGCAAAAAAIRV